MRMCCYIIIVIASKKLIQTRQMMFFSIPVIDPHTHPDRPNLSTRTHEFFQTVMLLMHEHFYFA